MAGLPTGLRQVNNFGQSHKLREMAVSDWKRVVPTGLGPLVIRLPSAEALG